MTEIHPQQADPRRTYTAPQAHRLIQNTLHATISMCTMYRLIRDGRLFGQRIGCKIIIPEHSLFEFLERCQRGERY